MGLYNPYDTNAVASTVIDAFHRLSVRVKDALILSFGWEAALYVQVFTLKSVAPFIVVSAVINSQLPSPCLAAFLLFQRDGEIQYENQKKTDNGIFNKHGNHVDGHHAHHIYLHRLPAMAKFYGIMRVIV